MKAVKQIKDWHSRNENILAIIAWIILTISMEIIGFFGYPKIDWSMVIGGAMFFVMFALLLGIIE